jgi:hypothetical protein
MRGRIPAEDVAPLQGQKPGLREAMIGQGTFLKNCIYCKRDESTTTFDGVEHVIPEAFGTL